MHLPSFFFFYGKEWSEILKHSEHQLHRSYSRAIYYIYSKYIV